MGQEPKKHQESPRLNKNEFENKDDSFYGHHMESFNDRDDPIRNHEKAFFMLTSRWTVFLSRLSMFWSDVFNRMIIFLFLSGIVSVWFPSSIYMTIPISIIGMIYFVAQISIFSLSSYFAKTKDSGLFRLGTDVKNYHDVWLSDEKCRRHFTVFGSSDRERSNFFLNVLANALSRGSGAIYVNGTGKKDVLSSIYSLAERYGRLDDVLVLNYMCKGGNGETAISNTMNPFTFGSDDSLAQMVVSLMDDARGDGAMWKGRATAMFIGVMRALVHLRNSGQLDLNVGAIRDHLKIHRIIDLADKEKYPDMPTSIRNSVTNYLRSLPCYEPERGYEQSRTTLDQHAYLEMQFTKIFGSLADVHGHIFLTGSPHVDMNDVIVNRRILVVMLPELEKSGDEVANLGKLVMANLKRDLGIGLGNRISDYTFAANRDYAFQNKIFPFVSIFDDANYYTIDGMDTLATVSTSFNVSLFYGLSDSDGLAYLVENSKKGYGLYGYFQNMTYLTSTTHNKIVMNINNSKDAELMRKFISLFDTDSMPNDDDLPMVDFQKIQKGNAYVMTRERDYKIKITDLSDELEHDQKHVPVLDMISLDNSKGYAS